MAAEPARTTRLAWLLAAIAIAIALSCSDSGENTRLGLGVYVPAAWSRARAVTGHTVHVVEERVPCRSCHEIGENELGPVQFSRCSACHADEAKIGHAKSQARATLRDGTTSDCTLCHRFTDAPPRGATETTPTGALLGAHAHAAGDCKHCHLVEQGETPGVRVHASEPCLNCHRPHEDATPQAGPCAACHQDVHTDHATQNKTPNQVCTTCHREQHAGAAEALKSCVECHSSHEPIVPPTALFEGGHVECVGCHRPHEFGQKKAANCRSCHADVAIFGSPSVTAHQQCASCHSPHDVKGTPDQACARCHSTQQSDHPRHGLVGSCVGCHDPHPSGVGSKLHARASACSSCHQAAHQDNSFHAGVDCKACHAPHDFVREANDHRACTACHAAELGRASHLAGHSDCASCHRGLPHHPLQPMAGCDNCHAQETSRVVAGHAKCVGCHEPHDGAQAKPCASCHAQEHATAPAGHRDCVSCHEGHSGSQKAACASCHAKEAGTPHGHVGTQCQDCHRPHGPNGVATAPACTTCHARSGLPGLHQEERHDQCNRCHSGHGQPSGALKEGCLTCHRERRQHFPDAPSCAACHLFTKNR